MLSPLSWVRRSFTHSQQSGGVVEWLKGEVALNAVGYRGITAKLDSIPAVSPQNRNPLPRYYRNVSPHFRGTTAVTAVIPLSPLPCSSLVWNDLPFHVASVPSLAVFRQQLKTFLFSRSYVPTKTLSYDSCVTITIHHYCLDTCGPCNN